jgi:GNAT superfamily N-acetyltransferase
MTEGDIRLLSEEDAEIFWPVRLRALKEEPESFGASHSEAVDMPPDKVRERLRCNEDAFVMGAFARDGSLLGVVGFYRRSGLKLRHKGSIWGMYVVPEARGGGLGRLLLTRALERIKTLKDIRAVELTVVTKQAPARQLYLDLGFRPYGLEREALMVDGQYLDEELMEISLL